MWSEEMKQDLMAFLYYAIGRIFFQKSVRPPQVGTIDYLLANCQEAYTNWLRSELERENPAYKSLQEGLAVVNARRAEEDQDYLDW